MKTHYKAEKAIIIPLAKRHLRAFCWRTDDDPTLKAGPHTQGLE